MDALSAHFELMQRARERGDVRTVPGRAYPVSREELDAWVARKASIELKRKRDARYRPSLTPRMVFG